MVRYLRQLRVDRSDAYRRYKIYLGRALLLGLEFLVAADIVRTVALVPTLLSVSMLGLLVVGCGRFLSWSLRPSTIEGALAVAREERGVTGMERHRWPASGKTWLVVLVDR